MQRACSGSKFIRFRDRNEVVMFKELKGQHLPVEVTDGKSVVSSESNRPRMAPQPW